jgi:hypothetical protein
MQRRGAKTTLLPICIVSIMFLAAHITVQGISAVPEQIANQESPERATPTVPVYPGALAPNYLKPEFAHYHKAQDEFRRALALFYRVL